MNKITKLLMTICFIFTLCLITSCKKTYELEYDANGGTGAPGNQTKTHGTAITISSTRPTRTGYTFLGWSTSSTATAADPNYDPGDTYNTNSPLSLFAVWKVNTYNNTINHWTFGYKNGEGNNANKTAYQLTTTSHSATYNQNFTYDAAKKTTIPNGFEFDNVIRSQTIPGHEWSDVELPITFKQPASAVSVEYKYWPIDYTITYNLDGGENNSSNPTTYNVLYGVNLAAPTRKGYDFLGWENESGTIVTGINPGANATFSSPEDLYAQLSSRDIGNKVLTALWRAKGSIHLKVGDQWVFATPWVKVNGEWKRGTFKIKIDGTWKEGI